MMFVGTLVSAAGAIVFQVVGGRSLGAEGFAPVSVMWTLLFLGVTIFLLPVEQFVIRALVLSGHSRSPVGRLVASVIGGAALLGAGFALVAADRLLDGDLAYVPVAVGMFIGHGLLAIARGHFAGSRRFFAYGVLVSLDALAKVTGAVIVAVAGLGPVAMSWALAVSPLVVVLLRPWRRASRPPRVERQEGGATDRRFMIGFLISTAASQTVLAAGPLVVGALEASAAAISVFFVTTTLFRGPMSASYNLLARILPTATTLAAAGDVRALDRWVRRLLGIGTVLALATGAVATLVGPAVVEWLYGADFRPEPWLTGLAAAAVTVGIFGLVTTQVLVGRGATGRMALVWLSALGAAALAVIVSRGEPSLRVAIGFLTGEAVAFLGLSAAALRR